MNHFYQNVVMEINSKYPETISILEFKSISYDQMNILIHFFCSAFATTIQFLIDNNAVEVKSIKDFTSKCLGAIEENLNDFFEFMNEKGNLND
jgi:hypothetical protein